MASRNTYKYHLKRGDKIIIASPGNHYTFEIQMSRLLLSFSRVLRLILAAGLNQIPAAFLHCYRVV